MEVSEKVAEEHLERANWNVEAALDKVLEETAKSHSAYLLLKPHALRRSGEAGTLEVRVASSCCERKRA